MIQLFVLFFEYRCDLLKEKKQRKYIHRLPLKFLEYYIVFSVHLVCTFCMLVKEFSFLFMLSLLYIVEKFEIIL